MVAFQIGVAVALLLTGQLDLQLEPEEVAMKQAAAPRLDDAKIDRYVALMREVQKQQPKLDAIQDEAARDKAEEQAVIAAAARVGFPAGEIPGISGLVTEWLMVIGPTGGPKEAAERKAGFVKRYGQKTADTLQRNDAKLKKALSDMIQAELGREGGKPK